MKTEFEKTCIGHITYWRRDCLTCKDDGYNEKCRHYIPMRVFDIKGIEKKVEERE